MARRIASILVALVACSTPKPSTDQDQDALTTCTTFVAAADTMLSNPPMEQSFGGLPILRAGGKDEALVRFDLSRIPSGAVIGSATLKLYINGSGSTAQVNTHAINADWSENSTYASFGQHFDAAVIAAFTTSSTNVQKSLDVTALATSWVSGARPNQGVLLETSSDKKTIFVSREGGNAAQKPQLHVCYTTPDDHCAPNPCEHAGTCTNTATSYTCSCAPGYTGTNCEAVIDNCASQPCLNGGACTSTSAGYTCSCAAGYTGATCETVIDNCASDPCQNGGTCVNGVGAYTCQCAPGYIGANCETTIDNCAASPCLNGGTCASGVNSYTCQCAPGFSGASCETNIDECAAQPCHHGTCVDGVNSYTCSCAPDWGGATCDVNLNACAQNPCLNGASCTDGFGTYTCACAAGYTGVNCEIDVNECLSNPCQNGGVCVDGVNSFTCSCPAGFTGSRCEQDAGCPGGGDGERACCNGCGEYSNVGTACDAGNFIFGTGVSRACGGSLCTTIGATTTDVCHAPKPCGGAGQRACCLFEDNRTSTCDSGLVEGPGCSVGDPNCVCTSGAFASGICTAPTCGHAGQRGCCTGEQTAVGLSGPCGFGLLESGSCSGQLGAASCHCLAPAGFDSSGVCVDTACGHAGQRGCCVGAERTVNGISGPCSAGLVEYGTCTGADCACKSPVGASSSGRCVAITPCGGEGQRACCLGEAPGGACGPGLVESGSCANTLVNCVCSSGATSLGVCVTP